MSKDSLFLILIIQALRVYSEEDAVTESESSLTQRPYIMTAEVGEMVELTCQYIYEVEYVLSYFWYKQRVGEAPKLIETQSCQAANCKFISKKGNNKHQLILKIRSVEVSDSGSYYCADSDSYAPLQNAPTLLVGDSSTNKTAVLVFGPPGELHLREMIPVVCLVSGVSPNQIVIFWNISCLVTEGPSDPGTMEADGTYIVRSHFIVSRETWRSGALCTCIVQLGSPNKYLTKSLSFSKAAGTGTGTGWCSLALPVLITVLVILVLLMVLISIWILKSGRSGERDKRSHKEKFSLKERRQGEGQNERQADDHRQKEGKRPHRDAIQTQGGPLYASLDLAALDKRAKKKAGRR